MRTLLFYFMTFIANTLFSQNPYTPEKGSTDRKEILDIFREDFEEKDKILFKVDHFLIASNWACANVIPLENNKEIAEPRWDLFTKVGGKWKSVDWAKDINIHNDFELIDLPNQKGRIAKLIVKSYPTCPITIFGK